MKIVEQLYEFSKNIILNLKSEYVALFSVIVTLVIFMLNRRAELRYKKYEERKQEYRKLIDFLNLTYTEPHKTKPEKNGKLSSELQKNFLMLVLRLCFMHQKNFIKNISFFEILQLMKHLKKANITIMNCLPI